MFGKFFTFLLLAVSNIALYYFAILLEPQQDFRMLFILVRAVLVTSLLMQVLTASGIARTERLW
jgi:hypothetical protein